MLKKMMVLLVFVASVFSDLSSYAYKVGDIIDTNVCGDSAYFIKEEDEEAPLLGILLGFVEEIDPTPPKLDSTFGKLVILHCDGSEDMLVLSKAYPPYTAGLGTIAGAEHRKGYHFLGTIKAESQVAEMLTHPESVFEYYLFDDNRNRLDYMFSIDPKSGSPGCLDGMVPVSYNLHRIRYDIVHSYPGTYEAEDFGNHLLSACVYPSFRNEDQTKRQYGMVLNTYPANYREESAQSLLLYFDYLDDEGTFLYDKTTDSFKDSLFLISADKWKKDARIVQDLTPELHKIYKDLWKNGCPIFHKLYEAHIISPTEILLTFGYKFPKVFKIKIQADGTMTSEMMADASEGAETAGCASWGSASNIRYSEVRMDYWRYRRDGLYVEEVRENVWKLLFRYRDKKFEIPIGSSGNSLKEEALGLVKY